MLEKRQALPACLHLFGVGFRRADPRQAQATGHLLSTQHTLFLPPFSQNSLSCSRRVDLSQRRMGATASLDLRMHSRLGVQLTAARLQRPAASPHARPGTR
jgi:hypothetical protein